ncbi:hypothetical protein BTR23_08225 [Alkalihalophilus pseudofirmus]|nr:hypothetical protein BTR23_08225 [Alkalihalophilus pseudofirmus]
MDKKIVELVSDELKERTNIEIDNVTFTKKFRSAPAEAWYVLLKNYKDPKTGGATGKAIIHYDLQGNRDIFINTTIIFDDPRLYPATTGSNTPTSRLRGIKEK